jgi:hypothetical protein
MDVLEEIEQILQEMVRRAQSDREFRQLCLNDPNTAAKQINGKGLPEEFALRFVENRDADLTVVLPDSLDASAELSEAELDRVAGGNLSPKAPMSAYICCGLSNSPS